MLDVSSVAIDALLRERRSIRRFRPTPVPRDVIDEVLRAALWAPSPHHAQPWRLTVLTSRGTRVRLGTAMAAKLAEELQADGVDPEPIGRQTARSVSRISDAPVIVVLSLVREGLVSFSDKRRDDLEWEMAVQSVGALLQSLFLAAHARGIGSCWMAAPMYCPEEVRATLRLPDIFVPQALALLGYPENPGKLRERRPFEDLVNFL